MRALELTELGSSLSPDADRLWTSETRLPTVVFGPDVPRAVLEDANRAARPRRCSLRVLSTKRVRALAGPISGTAVRALGLREVAELPHDEALAALVIRTRRYAAYQRKWLRRIPGLVSVNADRPVDEIAHDIVEAASARQRLPAGRTG